MKKVTFEEIFDYEKKSKIKAGDGLPLTEGKYPFFTSSNTLSKSINQSQFENPSLIFGTGGQASLHFYEDKFTVSTDCLVAKPRDEKDVFVKFVFYFLKQNDMRLLEEGFKGAGLKHISRKYINQIKIPLPPLETQKQIAEILDNAAALRDQTEQLLEEYDALEQSIFLDMFGDPVSNPKGWKVSELKDLTSKIGSGATPRGGKNAYKKEGISLIRSLNIYDNEFKYKDLAFINDKQAKKLNNVTIEENDVLINITGASIARCTIVPNHILPARVNQHVSILRSENEILNPIFLLHLIISPSSKIKLLGVGSSGGATREAITKTQLEEFEIPVPPLELQNEFAEKIALIEKQKELAKQELKESEDLFNALLQKAFKGELV